MAKGPEHKHYCKTDLFIGHYSVYDIYRRDSSEEIIARFGNAPADERVHSVNTRRKTAKTSSTWRRIMEMFDAADPSVSPNSRQC